MSVVGKKYKVVSVELYYGCPLHCFSVGEVVKCIEHLEDGISCYESELDGEIQYVPDDDLEEIEE